MRMAGRAYAAMVAAAIPATSSATSAPAAGADHTATHPAPLLQYDRPLGGLFQPTAETELSYFEAIMGCVGATAGGCSHAKWTAVRMPPYSAGLDYAARAFLLFPIAPPLPAAGATRLTTPSTEVAGLASSPMPPWELRATAWAAVSAPRRHCNTSVTGQLAPVTNLCAA